MSDKQPIVEFRNVSKWFPDPGNGERLTAVSNFTLTVEDEEAGEFIVILGPSGCGKSTILNLLAGLYQPDEGEVRTFGELITGPNPKSVTVPQSYTCFPWLTVLGNVQFGLGIQGKSPAEQQTVATEYLTKVGLADRARDRSDSSMVDRRVC